MGALFYGLNRHHFSDVTLSRWIQIGLAIAVAVGILSGQLAGLLIAVLAAALLIGFTVASILWRRRSYVRFEASDPPAVTPAPLDPIDKIPVFATGLFGVEGKHTQFTWLQGYFRTFATREHALLCLVQPRRFALFGSWPEKEVGMWYIFFNDADVEQIRWGTVHHGDRSLTGLAISHRIFVPARGRFDRDKTLHRTAYIACPDPGDARRILADLRYDQEEVARPTPSQNGAGRMPSDEQQWRRIEG